jgi:Kef-type K+ transport system membrane component KefB
VVQLFSSRTFQAAVAFLICFAVGALLSTIMGLDWKSWLLAGIATSTTVAWSVFRVSGSKER